MGAFDLAGSLTFNTSKGEASLGRMDAKMTAFADKVEHRFSHKLSHVFGSGFLVGALLGPLEKLKEVFSGGPDMAKGIQESAEKLHVTGEEYQMIELAAKAAGQTVDDFMASMAKSGHIDEAVKSLEQFRSQVALTDEDIANLTAEGGFWARLNKFGAKTDSRIFGGLVDMITSSMLRSGGMSQEDVYQGLKEDDKAQALNARYRSSDRIKAAIVGKSATAAFKPEFAINEWQRIGAAVGGSGGNTIANDIRRTAVATEKLANGLIKLGGNKDFRGAGAGGQWGSRGAGGEW